MHARQAQYHLQVTYILPSKSARHIHCGFAEHGNKIRMPYYRVWFIIIITLRVCVNIIRNAYIIVHSKTSPAMNIIIKTKMNTPKRRIYNNIWPFLIESTMKLILTHIQTSKAGASGALQFKLSLSSTKHKCGPLLLGGD